MATIAPPAPPAVAVEPHDVLAALVPCDRSDCPAWATKRVDLSNQDFYFCGHHLREVQELLGISATPPTFPT
jgi:hypothetical protein